MEIHIKARYLNDHTRVVFGRYARNGALAISLISMEGEPLARATVNVGVKLEPGHVAIKDYAENEGIEDALVEAGVIEMTETFIPCGFECVGVGRLTDDARREARRQGFAV